MTERRDGAQGRGSDVSAPVPEEAKHPADIDKDGDAASTKGVKPGDTSHFGAVETDVADTGTPVPGAGGDPNSPIDPANETPGG